MIVGRQEWEHLLFIHYEVDENALRRQVPERLELDRYDGKTWVTIIPLRIRGSRPVFVPRATAPILPGSSFEELNFRTYVLGPNGDRGIWFFSLDAASRFVVTGARMVYALPYHHARMSLNIADGAIRFDSRRISGPERCEAHYRPLGSPETAVPGTLDHFLVERYVLFTAMGKKVSAARVYHEPYPVQRASIERWEETLLEGRGLTGIPLGTPHYARGLRVGISAPFRIV